MNIVNTNLPVTSSLNLQYIRELTEKYPFLRSEILTESAFGRPVPTLVLGTGGRKVLYAASFHANEWITTPLLLGFAEELAEAYEAGGEIDRVEARRILEQATIYMVPMVNPDGVDLVLGETTEEETAGAKLLAARYPRIPFPEGWKANLLGVDLNLQYPAGWEKAREIKFLQGYTRPGPRNFVGQAPLNQKESRALVEYTERLDPDLVLAYHTQGQEIYWQYGGYEIPGARALGEKFASVSGYRLAEPSYNSGFAGYKDWFIERFRRPGYTVEAGIGENPLQMEQFPKIYDDNLGILVTAALG